MSKNTNGPTAEFDGLGHRLDALGDPIHIDVDPVLPTGICAVCEAAKPDTEGEGTP